MEKLSVEEKAKLYDEALKKAKDCQFDGLTLSQPVRDVIEYIFPKLKEDERIKSCIKMCLTDADEQRFDDYNISLKDCLAWLEKPKETATSDKDSSNKNTSVKNKKKYILTDETIDYCGHKLYRIKAIRSFSGIRKGSLGGWVESENNLSQEGDCWVLDEAKVFSKAKVSENARILNNACIYGNAAIHDNTKISGYAKVYGNVCIYDYVLISEYAKVFGSINICGHADIRGEAEIKFIKDYAVFENIGTISNRFTWTRSNNMWTIGNSFYGSGEELIKRGYRVNELTGKCCEVIVKAQEEILKLSK